MTSGMLMHGMTREQEARAVVQLMPAVQANMVRQIPKLHEMGPCVAPFSKATDTGAIMLLPCGDCSPCRRRKLLGAIGLSLLGAMETRMTAFRADLTFKDEDLPGFDELLDPEFLNYQFRALRERMRYHYGSKTRMEIVAQLGSNTARFHYHVLVYPGPKNEKEWQNLQYNLPPEGVYQEGIKGWKGRTEVRPITPSNVQYVKGYIHRNDKGTFKYGPAKQLGDKIMSQIIDTYLKKGKHILLRNLENWYELDNRVYPAIRKHVVAAREKGLWLPQSDMTVTLESMEKIHSGELLGNNFRLKKNKEQKRLYEKMFAAQQQDHVLDALNAVKFANRNRHKLEDPVQLMRNRLETQRKLDDGKLRNEPTGETDIHRRLVLSKMRRRGSPEDEM